jgi:uncharacterized protein
LLLYAAWEALGRDAERVLAVSGKSLFVSARESDAARRFCAEQGIPLCWVSMDVHAVPGLMGNPEDRCYRCKQAMLGTVVRTAAARGFDYVVEGSNASDLLAWRPGERAVKELGVGSPLLEAGLTKAEVRELARDRGLAVWDKPASGCLATRFATGTPLSDEGLVRVDAAEGYLLECGFGQLRVRSHGNLARIECDESGMALLGSAELRARVDAKLRELGFAHVTVDLGGYQTGSMDPNASAS